MFKKMISVVAVALLGVSLATPVEAAAIVTDNGTTAPTLGVGDTGNVVALTDPFDRFGWNSGEDFGQTFTLATNRTLDSIYFAYNGFEIDESITFTLTVESNGGNVYTETGITMAASDFTQGDDQHYAQIDLSGESITLTAGSSSFLLDATADVQTDGWVLAPLQTGPTANTYPGGIALGFPSGYDNNENEDMVFAVTTTPEPATMTLLAIGGLGVLLMRRRRRA